MAVVKMSNPTQRIDSLEGRAAPKYSYGEGAIPKKEAIKTQLIRPSLTCSCSCSSGPGTTYPPFPCKGGGVADVNRVKSIRSLK
ncbi:hypothetical protein [Exiguobacterium sp. BMC-KP]|uniref:hypothetical protein n=1 Tax=Exiguobacterium sp. BMC-KP TaxID=1684312 RepID=UPI000ADD5CCD|nr:hypothetical protein [Exiguobacterium sp. BMC-KP]